MRLLRFTLSTLLALPLAASAQTAAPTDPFSPLSFLVGSWSAKAASPTGAAVNGTYSFAFDLKHHILARHTTTVGSCKGPADFDCQHGDLLYIYQDAPTAPLKAIYFDNEGHTIHYAVTTPTPTSVIFLSDATQPGPHFRLMYELKDGNMLGKFQMQMPGQTEWHSYLEWTGTRQ